MLFSERLKSEHYPPWQKHYIAYDQLKRLLKESADKVVKWTEEDESRFVQLLDKELDKVYSFEANKFDELSQKLTEIESQHATVNINEKDLERLLDDTTHLDRFRRLNYTGFTKIVRKHDKLHPEYHVDPLLQARFRNSPFGNEDYRPLLSRLGKLYSSLDSSQQQVNSKLNSVDRDFHSNGYVTLQFWVHPDNLMEVKTRVLRKLPVLVYNREDDDDDKDPFVTSLYLDNREFQLYQSLLERTDTDLQLDSNEKGPSSLRFRWYGKLSERPEIVFEKHNELDGQITRVNLKEKVINKFLLGDHQVVEKQAKKMKERHVHSKAIKNFECAANDLQKFVKSNELEPMLRTVYKRTAFEIPGDDKVRVILDQDILFLREDSLDRQRPIRDSNNWHRTDIDQNVDMQSVLRKGEFARFPYSVLEVRLRAGINKNDAEKLPWIEELKHSKLIKEIPHFTKFLHGVAVLYGDDDRLDTLPFWLSELDHKEGEHEQHVDNVPVPKVSTYKFDEDEFDEFDSDDSGVLGEFGPSESDDSEGEDVVGLPTRVRDQFAESEDDEVILPAGVERPKTWSKNKNALKIEAKVWLANERTFNKWLHITCLMSALTFTLYNSVGRASSQQVANFVAFVLFGLTIFCGVWGYVQYMKRIEYIKRREDKPMDAPFGPIVVSIVLLLALIINFVSVYSAKSTQ